MNDFQASGGVSALAAACDTQVATLQGALSMDDYYASVLEMDSDSSAYFFVDVKSIVSRVQEWKDRLPLVKPFYAVKCNDHPVVLQAIKMCGCGFDCSSQAEIERVRSLQVSPSDIVYANTVKEESMLRAAAETGVTLTTFDCEDELRKIKKVCPQMRLLLRIAVDDSGAVCKFSSKFGAVQESWGHLLALASSLELKVAGVSFHVGSGQKNTDSFCKAIAESQRVFALAEHYNYALTVLDIGGGFSGAGDVHVTFADTAEKINAALHEFKGRHPGLLVMAEPGRFFVEDSHTLAATVIGQKRLCAEQLKQGMEAERVGNEASGLHSLGVSDSHVDMSLTLNSGLYDAFSSVVFDHKIVRARPLSKPRSGGMRKFKLFGPTCDSIDVVSGCALLPVETGRGDRVLFDCMGAYTTVSSSSFNGQGQKRFHFFF